MTLMLLIHDPDAALKQEITKPSTLALYNPQVATKISTDASSYSLGAVLLQEEQGSWKPVAFASKALTETEQRYAQIEKEALAIVWACNKLHLKIETDHKLLVPLLSTKHLDTLPPRILRFRLQMARYDYAIHHSPGKSLLTADTHHTTWISQVRAHLQQTAMLKLLSML